MTNFEGVISTLSQALSKRGYTALTPVQLAVLAPDVGSADLLVSAQTGSGKTVAFGISIAPTMLESRERFDRSSSPLALIIAPTRELALQVQRELEWLFASADAIVASCVGGMDMRTERRILGRGAHIVVGTPGRLSDHVNRGSLNLSGIKAVVLDEADEMLDMGFRDELEFILNATPKERRTLMFSATVPKSIITLAKRYQQDAVRLSTGSEKEPHRDIEYCAFTVGAKDKENAIINVLRFYDAKTAIVFCATRATVNRMTSRFNNRGFSVVALSGELSQSQRTQALQAIRDGRARVCIATDVAARGIDLPNLDLVVHADLPKNKDSLLHRSGRTGRAGRKGITTLIVPHNARKRVERLFNNAKINANWSNPPTAHEISLRDDERILQEPRLNDPLEDREKDLVERLMKIHSAEQIAGAFVRLYRSGQSAPEEISDLIISEDKSRRTTGHKGRSFREHSAVGRDTSGDAFTEGVWFSLSVGRKHTAEARWLLPAIIRAGNLSKGDVGAIKIEESETYFEISPKIADEFMEALGPSRKLEKSMSVTRVPGYPGALAEREEQLQLNKRPRKLKKNRANVRENADDLGTGGRSDHLKRVSGKIKKKLSFKRKITQRSEDQKTSEVFQQTSFKDEMTKLSESSENYLSEKDEKRDSNRKKKKSKKIRKNKGKRRKRVVTFITEQDQSEFVGGPRLKLTNVARKTRARVTRKATSQSEPGSSPLKRKK